MVAGRAGDESLHSESLLTRAEEEEGVFKHWGDFWTKPGVCQWRNCSGTPSALGAVRGRFRFRFLIVG